MPVVGVVGEFYGDEGKGKIVDLYASGEFDHTEKPGVVARFNGGANAGHTLLVPKGVIDLHQVPSGIATEGTVNVMGNGMLVDPVKLAAEIDKIESFGIAVTPENLLISSAATLVMPYHISADEIREKTEDGQGSTKCGIAFAAADKGYRIGFQVGALCGDMEPLRENIQNEIAAQWDERQRAGLPEHDFAAAYDQFREAAERIGKYVTDTVLYLNGVVRQPKDNAILAEGAQAFWLDVDQGSYPNTSSTSSSANGIPTGLGIASKYISRIIGVSKATPSRVGNGPFPTEIFDDELGSRLRGKEGDVDAEFGTTTGRERRMGYLDLPMMRRAQLVNGTDSTVITKLDRVVEYGEEIPVCVGYTVDRPGSKTAGKAFLDVAPASSEELQRCHPVYIHLPGWKEDISGVRAFEDLPPNAQHYISTIEKYTGVPVSVIGVGPGREEIIVRS